MKQFNNLPIELQDYILSYIEEDWHHIIMSVSRLWYHIIARQRKIKNMDCYTRKTPICIAIQSISLLNWALEEQGLPKNKLICKYAILNQKLNVLKWARSINCEWDLWSCMYAVESKNKEILEWIHNNGCPWGWWTIISTVEQNNIDMLKWLYSQKCACSKLAYKRALSLGHYQIAHWISNNTNC
jgi:hypothetical protein